MIRYGRLGVWFGLLALGLPAGCGVDGSTRQQRDASSEPNNYFDTAAMALPGGSGAATIVGTISSGNDVDVFDLGPAAAGDTVQVSIRATSGTLAPTVALFDDQTRIIAPNPVDTIGRFSYTFDETIRHSTATVYLGVAAENRANGYGDYEATVRFGRGGPIPSPVHQTLVLNFAGGRVRIPLSGFYRFPPFTAEVVGFPPEDTEPLKEMIWQTVADNFALYDLTILTSDDPIPAEAYSVVHFGGSRSDLFGVASGVDAYNRDPSDEAIVFVGGFAAVFNRLPEPPDLEGMARAIGNVATHEAGHLLGLNHTDDLISIMDSVHPSSSLLGDQEFIWADLADQLFPIGTQDAQTLLIETVGLVP